MGNLLLRSLWRFYEVVEKVAKSCATSARILVPKDWVGKRVRAVRLDP